MKKWYVEIKSGRMGDCRVIIMVEANSKENAASKAFLNVNAATLKDFTLGNPKEIPSWLLAMIQ